MGSSRITAKFGIPPGLTAARFPSYPALKGDALAVPCSTRTTVLQRRIMSKLPRVLLLLASLSLGLRAQTARVSVMAGVPPGRAAIWVLQPDNKLAAYDAADFRHWQTLALPPEAKDHPESISISRQGAVLAAYPPGENVPLRRFWQSDPRLGSSLFGGAADRAPAPGGGYLITSAVPQVHFTSDPERLFWFENRKQTLNRDYLDISVTTVFLAWTTNRHGEDVRQVAEAPFPTCACDTGSCEETCPEAQVWAPEAGITDFFFVTRWVPGQLQSDFQQTDLYRLQNGRWVSQKLPAPVEQFADMADHGNVFIAVVSDRGCCGWENESDDQTLLFRNVQSTVIYDERERFHNDNYDVSFFTSRARLSPDGSRVAYTLAATARPSVEIRLSDSGKDNPEELRRIKKAISELPRVEVLAVADPKKVAVGLPGELVDWLDGKRILIVQAGELVVLDVDSGTKVLTKIKAPSALQVFVR